MLHFMPNEKRITPLRRAIDALVKQGVIKNDADLANKMGLKSRGSLSSYINGEPSRTFREQFENTFNVSLDEFKEGSEEKPSNYTDKYIKLLEEQNERMTNLILNDLANIKASLEQLSESQAGIALVSHQARDFAIEVLSKSLKVPSAKMKQDADKELASSAEGIVKKGK